ncbi:MAG: beta-lactamase family protein, partial [Chloroflexi bacterium]|nr:beta-lactamase family protein [Chloroflexota bacterium]
MTTATSSSANATVERALQSLIDEGPELGLQVAAYVDGRLVIDAWAGVADEATGRRVDGDTLFMLSSTTKGITATLAAILADKGKLDYDRPMASYWPEFG